MSKSRKCDQKRIPLAGIFYDIAKRKPFYKDMEAIRLLNHLMTEEMRPTVELPISRLIATQTHINDDYDKVINRYKPTDKDVLPSIVKYEGRFYLVDGHHRTYAQYRQGNMVLKLSLFDLDRNTQYDMPLLEICDQDSVL